MSLHENVDSNFKLQLLEKAEPVVFLHIGKAGGTSFDVMMKKIKTFPYVGTKHFDWSYIDHHHPTGKVVTILRDPVSRSISHFSFMKTLSWTKGMTIRSQSLSEFLNDKISMMSARGAWQDGQAAVSWLTGTHVGFGWVKKGPNPPSKEALELKNLQFEEILNLAADRIDNIFWFGLLEDMDRSLELLTYQLRLEVPVRKNKYSKSAQVELIFSRKK